MLSPRRPSRRADAGPRRIKRSDLRPSTKRTRQEACRTGLPAMPTLNDDQTTVGKHRYPEQRHSSRPASNS
jgi:hypothetical protein